MIPMADIDLAFTKQQLLLFLSNRYMHPTGQVRANVTDGTFGTKLPINQLHDVICTFDIINHISMHTVRIRISYCNIGVEHIFYVELCEYVCY